ncbi:MAG: hypothetical protein WEB19_01170 [Acidimicrobiia bacterium]
MLPFERLRALARYGGDDHGLALEAADCLADFASDPTQLVTVCRRLLAHHPTCGPLWWLCARAVAAPDLREATRDAVRLLDADRTAPRLASLLPFPHDEPVAVLGWPDTVAAALAERPDLDVLAIRMGADRHLRARLARSEAPMRVVDETEAIAFGPSHLLVEVMATSPTTAVVPEGVESLLWSLANVQLWLVAGVGRLLPERMFATLRAEIERDDDLAPRATDTELLDVTKATRIAGPAGLDPPERLATRIDCPVAAELLRL